MSPRTFLALSTFIFVMSLLVIALVLDHEFHWLTDGARWFFEFFRDNPDQAIADKS